MKITATDSSVARLPPASRGVLESDEDIEIIYDGPGSSKTSTRRELHTSSNKDPRSRVKKEPRSPEKVHVAPEHIMGRSERRLTPYSRRRERRPDDHRKDSKHQDHRNYRNFRNLSNSKSRHQHRKVKQELRETLEETDEEFRRRLLEADRIHFYGQPGPAEFIGRRPPTHNDFHPISTIYSEVVKSALGSIARTTGCELEMMEPSAFVSYQKIGMNGSDEEIRKAHELLDDFIMAKESGRVNEDGEKTVCRFLHVPPDIKEKLFKEEHEKWKTILRTSGVLCEKVRNMDDDNAPFLLRGKLRYMEELNMMITSFLDDIRNGVTETFYVQNEDVEKILGSNGALLKTLSRSTATNVEVERRSGRITVRGRKSSVTKAMIHLDRLTSKDVRFDVKVPMDEYGRTGLNVLRTLWRKSEATWTPDDVPRDGLVRIACRGSLRNAHYAKHLAEIEFGIIEKDAEFRPKKDRRLAIVDPRVAEDERNRMLLQILESEMSETF